MELQGKAVVLKKYETFCYRVAFYLLGNEEDAVHAARDALLELGQDCGFFRDPESHQLQKAKAAAMRHSLNTKRRLLGRKSP